VGRRPARAAALVHGDLHARHLLIDDGGGLCGVIDRGDVHLGDPATDLAVTHAFLPPPARAAFLAAYGPVDEGTRALARFRAVSHSALVVLYAHDAGDEHLLAEGLRALGRVAAG
jgi:aminoglycoside phosphotransferase (APT) family kinase protein